MRVNRNRPVADHSNTRRRNRERVKAKHKYRGGEFEELLEKEVEALGYTKRSTNYRSSP